MSEGYYEYFGQDGDEAIYANADNEQSHHVRNGTENFDTSTKQTPQHTGSKFVRNKSFILGLMCVLLLAAVIVLCVQSHIKSKNYTEEREQLLTKNMNLTRESRRSLTTIFNLINQLKSLNQEKKDLWNRFCKTDKWIYHQINQYYISCEMKSWHESGEDCLRRGADLIIINNKEKQDFVQKLSGNERVWIGLSDSAEEGTWKWVNGSTLTPHPGFWKSGEPENFSGIEDCAVSYNSRWAARPCNKVFTWICEKSVN